MGKVALRKLRRFARTGAQDQLDLDGTIRGTAHKGYLDIVMRPEPESGSVLAEVRDTGHGIEPQDLRRIFDPFFTTRGVGEGTGLGLSIVKEIIELHGGQVEIALHQRSKHPLDIPLVNQAGTPIEQNG